MNFPISQGDYAVIETPTEYIMYRIHSITILELNNDPHAITHEKKENIQKELRITCQGKDEQVMELSYDNTDYYLNGEIVFFIRESMKDLIDEYMILEEYDPREKLNFEKSEFKLNELFNSDDYWASRFWNDFLNIDKIRVIINAKPASMTWRDFYINIINKIDVSGRLARKAERKTGQKAKSIFTPLFKVLGY